MTYLLSVALVVVFLLACVGACVCVGVVLHWWRARDEHREVLANAEFVRSLNDELLARAAHNWTPTKRRAALRSITGGKDAA